MARMDFKSQPSTEKLKLLARIGELEIALNESTKLLNEWTSKGLYATERISWDEIEGRVRANRRILPVEWSK